MSAVAKYGIKIVSTITEEGSPKTVDYWMKNLSEYEGEGNIKLLEFDTQEEAEIYAQNHELSNFVVEYIPMNARG